MSSASRKTSHGGRRTGAGRKAKYENTVTLAASVPAELRDELDEWAIGKGVNRSEAVVEAIRRLLKRRHPRR